jgi:hypothetical protein
MLGVECLAEPKRSEDWWMFDAKPRGAKRFTRPSLPRRNDNEGFH